MTERGKHRRQAPLRLVEAYWLGLCEGESVPLRSAVDPRGMESALEYAFLMERIAPSIGKLRVAGSHLSDLMGMQVAGMPLSCLIAPEDRDAFGRAVTRLFADPATLRIALRAESGFGKPDMGATMLLLPLRSDFGEVSRALGALVTDGRIGRTPRRFRVESITVEPALPGTHTMQVDRDALAERPQPALLDLARESLPESDDLLESDPRAHLRLVVSND